MQNKFYKCDHCGNIITFAVSKGVPVMCCRQKMTEITPNTVDAAQEKHVPTYSVNGSNVVVKVGAVEHPMTSEHYISFISITTRAGQTQMKELTPNEKPMAVFELVSGDELESVYAYCNLHGLWKAEVEKKECSLPKTTDTTSDYIVCKCNKVSYLDIVNALKQNSDINNVLGIFEKVKNVTHCSTGCGGCYDKVIGIISDVMSGDKN